MKRTTNILFFWIGFSLLLLTAVASASPVAKYDPVTSNDLVNAAANTSNWIIYGHTYNNWRYSQLKQITTKNVKNLKPMWTISTGGKFGGLESTPLFYNGILLFSADYSRVFAVDAATGKILWKYTPKYKPQLAAMLCCGPVNRGIALKGDLIYVETLNDHLVALNARDGTVAWNTTIDNWKTGVTETGAPLVIRDHVIVGIAGGEYGGRGYLKSFDTKTGKLQWTTYTVPGPKEHGHLTWPSDTWKHGGGPTWVTGSYDNATNTLYWGVGNPGPWAEIDRPGKNLWTDSLLALNPDTGKIKWGYQYTPNDNWDYDGIGGPVLATVSVDGHPYKAAIEANRNGFLYVIDRTNGRFLYAVPMIPGINWTSGLNPITGQPKINPAMKPTVVGKTVGPIVPGLEGGTNWFPPAYDPLLHYVFLNVNHWAMTLSLQKKSEYPYKPGSTYIGENYQMYRIGKHIGYTKAFDLKTRKFVWEDANRLPMFSGLLATAGNLVFTGDEDGNFEAIDAKTGKVLWKFQTGSGINASPITYELDGKQYIAVLSGLGGDPSFYYSGPHGGMLWVFSVDGKQEPSDAVNAVVIKSALPTYKPSVKPKN
ncbi:PQQ-dependent dehydrogenase, methanol/ethanol family [Acidiphilium sp. AL]|uniref:PQQ-dependent dehydrogenase, methanol/ethanol family n=1 Tax=Acidiphilium sp. AL TaxID=2871704 RepID=UPI0021CAEA92|nr:PQQ-dependent dehydrogenase, methanol/ethanol family [Acidiphilium sp. AL]MCU4162273.1 PQQ-dependent dehydrogenase, methanol/ethanol family [Acidiphilium sp. AL]